jgi:hypothetical protein
MSQFSECSCKHKNKKPVLDTELGPDLEEGGNCICIDCKCHYYKRETDDLELLQNTLRNYGMICIGTSTLLYTIYIFCCDRWRL